MATDGTACGKGRGVTVVACTLADSSARGTRGVGAGGGGGVEEGKEHMGSQGIGYVKIDEVGTTASIATGSPRSQSSSSPKPLSLGVSQSQSLAAPAPCQVGRQSMTPGPVPRLAGQAPIMYAVKQRAQPQQMKEMAVRTEPRRGTEKLGRARPRSTCQMPRTPLPRPELSAPTRIRAEKRSWMPSHSGTDHGHPQ